MVAYANLFAYCSQNGSGGTTVSLAHCGGEVHTEVCWGYRVGESPQ